MKKNTNNPKKVSEEDLMLSMMKRVSQVEKELNDAKKLITDQNKQISELKAGDAQLKQEKIDNSKKACSHCKILQSHISELDKYIDSTNEFIKDQGFILMNIRPVLDDNSINSSNIDHNTRFETIKNSISEMEKELGITNSESDLIEEDIMLPQKIDYHVLSRRIEEINMLVYKDGAQSRYEKDSDNIYKLKHVKELKVYFYKNGLVIEGYKFYKYDSSEAKRILHDILDGYSPYILKGDHPDGTLLQPVNFTEKDYNTNQDSTGKNVLDPNVKKEKISGAEFLSRMPEKVIRNGQIYNIRDDLEKMLIVKRDNTSYFEEKEEYYLCDKDKLVDYKNQLCKLKIQLLIIDKIITVNVLKTAKFDTLFDFLKSTINSKLNLKIKNIETYVLYSNYPRQMFFYDEPLSFQENNLYPTYFLIFEDKAKLNL